MFYYFLQVIVSVLLSLNSSAVTSQAVPTDYDLPEWDYLMFSQRWPISSCIEWEDKSKKNICTLPNDPNLWTVHGLWPTKNGSTEEPNNCKSAIHFDPDQIATFLDDLENHWTNIEGGTKANSFWSHEWDKHGTCASSLPKLNSVYNYFYAGLQLNNKFNLSAVLSASNVVPNTDNYTVESFTNAIQKGLNVMPQIHCVTDAKTKESLVNEIRLCLNKDLEPFDCTSLGLQVTDCSKKKPIKFLKDVPGEMAPAYVDTVHYIDPQEILAREEVLQEWYILVKFLMWFTL